MKLLAVIYKSILEQIRQFWILLLTISMAAFFVGVFYLIYKSESLSLKVTVVNLDRDDHTSESHAYGHLLSQYLDGIQNDTLPISFKQVKERALAETDVLNKKSDAILIIPSGFSDSIQARLEGSTCRVPFELSGNISETNYMLAAIMTHAYVSAFINQSTLSAEPYHFTETPMGMSSSLDDFSMAIPGLLVLATIMLIFSGAISFVSEPEKKTMMRLKLSKLSPFTFLSGITVVQTFVGLISILITLFVAYLLDFSISGSPGLFLLVCILICISVVGFSLILAGLTKSVNEVLIVGNFPMFLFMFFSGTVFPVHGKTLFTFASYDFTIPGLMSTYHGTEALKKISIFGAGLQDIWPELVCLTGLSVIYFGLGYWLYRKKHMEIF